MNAIYKGQLWMVVAAVAFASTVCLAQKTELVVQTGHSGLVFSVAFSPDGKTLASGSYDETIRLWDVSTGTELRSIKANSHWVYAVAFSPNGRTLASGGDDHTIKLWDVSSGIHLRTLNGHSESVTSVAFSPDGKTLASAAGIPLRAIRSAGIDNTVKLWDVSTGMELRTLRGHSDGVLSVAFSPDGKTLASGSRDNTIKLWDVLTGAELRTIKGNSSQIVAFSPDGNTLANSTPTLWDVKTGLELRTLQEDLPQQSVSVAYSTDGKIIAAGAGDNIRLWDVSSGTELRTLKGHTSTVLSVAFSPDGNTLASGSYDETIKLWDIATSAELRTLKGHSDPVRSLALSPDGKTLASGGRDGTVKLWDVATGKELVTLKGHSDLVVSLAFSPDGRTLASGSWDNTVRIWDTRTATELRTIKRGSHSIWSVAFSPDGRILAIGGADHMVELWDVFSANQLCTLEGHSDWVSAVAFNSDGKILASGSRDSTVKLWDVSTCKELRSLTGHSNWVFSVAFSPDGRTLATGSMDNSVKLWDVSTGMELRTLKAHSNLVATVTFSANGKILVSGSRDQTVKLWDVSTRMELRTVGGHSNDVASVTFAVNDKYLLSGSIDTTIRIWDVASAKELASLIALNENDWIVVTPEGLFDGSVRSWKQILWRFSNKTFEHAPVEAFFREYWRPGLLADIMAGKPVEPPKKDLSIIDIRQPQARITNVGGQPTIEQALGAPLKVAKPISDRNIEVKIEVTENANPSLRSGQSQQSGAKDLRLFRNGSLVNLWQGDIFEKTSGCERVPTKPDEPRRAICKATVPVAAGDNNFTAYAFNHDDVKSSDSEAVVKGTDALKRRGTAYILAVGVNKYANEHYELKYAVPDAEDFAAEVKHQQELLKQYANIEVIPLYNADATKKNILLALQLLGGSGQLPPDAPDALKQIKKAEPEDLVMVYFAGHGTAHEKEFYLLPHDLGYSASDQMSRDEALKVVLANSISAADLQGAFEKVDAGHLLLVIDACNSGQVLEAEEKRRGPMNSKGLAQLAYEKGMYILTASQSFQAAQEVSELKHGLLTYALVEEGLKQGKADKNDKGEITERSWLDYATRSVPEMQIEQMKRRYLELADVQQNTRGSELVFVEGDDSTADPEKRYVQRPRVFYRRELEARPLVIARQ